MEVESLWKMELIPEGTVGSLLVCEMSVYWLPHGKGQREGRATQPQATSTGGSQPGESLINSWRLKQCHWHVLEGLPRQTEAGHWLVTCRLDAQCGPSEAYPVPIL